MSGGDRQDDPKAVTPEMIEAARQAAAQWLAEHPPEALRWKRALRILLDGASLNARSAAKKYGELNFRKTVAEIQARGVQLRVRPEISFSAIGPIVLRPRLGLAYTLHRESRALAEQLLGGVGAEK